MLYNDDILIGGENVFKKMFTKVKTALQNKNISVGKQGVNVVSNEAKPQITTIKKPVASSYTDLLKNPGVIGGVALLAVLILKKKR